MNLFFQAEGPLNCNRIDLTVEKPDARHVYEKKLKFTPVATTVLRLSLPTQSINCNSSNISNNDSNQQFGESKCTGQKMPFFNV